MMIIPNRWKNNPNVPNHQPEKTLRMRSDVKTGYNYYKARKNKGCCFDQKIFENLIMLGYLGKCMTLFY